MQTYILNIRLKRQTTIPDDVLKELNLEIGDKLQAQVKDNKIILTPQKQAVLDTFSEIQRLFADSEIKEKDLQANLKMIRKETYVKRSGI